MDILFRLLIALEAIVCVLLIGIVLIQRSKGQGVGLSFGGGAEAVFGAQMGNVLTRATVVLGIIFLVNTAILAILRPTSRGESLAERAPVSAPDQVEETAASAADAEEALEFLETEAAGMEVPADAETVPAADAEAVVPDAPEAVDVEAPAIPEEESAPAVDVPEAPAAPEVPAAPEPAAETDDAR